MAQILNLEEIKKYVDADELIKAIETGFSIYSSGKVVVPPVGFLNFDQPPADVHIKYGYITDDDYYVIKIASGFYDNPQIGLPMADGLVLVFSQKTGQLKKILIDECWLTEMRTAAAGAVAAKHLAPKKVSAIGIVGTGSQARYQLELHRTVVDCKTCYVWGRNKDKVDAMIADLNSRKSIQEWGIDIKAAKDMDELTSNCNLIVTTTSARGPIIWADQVQKGTHITAMGSDDHGKYELDPALLAKADIVVADSLSQCIDHGECCPAVKEGLISESSIIELGTLINDPSLGRLNDEQITIADQTGVAIHDIQIAKMVDKAYEKGNEK